MWLCKCNCPLGSLVAVRGHSLRQNKTKSCGCLQKEIVSYANKEYNIYDLSNYEYGVGYTNKGEEFYFDLEDYDKIKNYCWYLDDSKYVKSNYKRSYLSFHRLILHTNSPVVDHRNGIPFDNRKSNLRPCNQSFNEMNRSMMSNNTSGTTGICWDKRSCKWLAHITKNHKFINLGYFTNKEDAVYSRKEAEELFFGEFSFDNSRINEIKTQKEND